VLAPEKSRQRLARTLSAAYADGLLSDDTFARRLDEAFKEKLVHPEDLVGDLAIRGPRRDRTALLRKAANTAMHRVGELLGASEAEPPLLALDWSGLSGELVIGRDESCDIVLPDPTVSRRHAKLVYRSGGWVIQDLASRNGTMLNGHRVGRSTVWPGDWLDIGGERFLID
jgi:hypothetical protein